MRTNIFYILYIYSSQITPGVSIQFQIFFSYRILHNKYCSKAVLQRTKFTTPNMQYMLERYKVQTIILNTILLKLCSFEMKEYLHLHDIYLKHIQTDRQTCLSDMNCTYIHVYTRYNPFAHPSCTSLFILLFIKSSVYCFANFTVLHILLFIFSSSFYVLPIFIYILLCCVTFFFFALSIERTWPDYISLLIISCIIEYVTNKRTLNLDFAWQSS